MKHFLALSDFTSDELIALLDRADVLRTCWRTNTCPANLRGERVALWMYGQGFRNRLGFELGAQALGATVAYVPGDLGVHEPLEDIAAYLRNWFSVLVLRARSHADLLTVASADAIPVINARTDRSHPCEIMGDLLFVRRRRGSLESLNVVFVGEATNVGMSWLDAATVLPIRVTQVCPRGYEVGTAELEAMRSRAVGELRLTHDLDAALRDVDVLYTDCWPRTETEEAATAIRRAFSPYRIEERHLERLAPAGVFLPCPPVTRGQEVSADVMRSPRCHNYAAKDDLLHAQNAILEMVVTSARTTAVR